jgi:NAD-dependent dihydropyrimidine dehydrogenase PreA subunit
MRMTVIEERCPQDHCCPAVLMCPVSAISQKDELSLPVIDQELCVVCGDCMQFCPKSAFIQTEE